MNKSGIILTSISLFLALASCLIYFFVRFDERILLAFLGLVVAFYFGILRLHVEGDKLFKDLFSTFNDRYDDGLNDLLNSLRDEPNKDLNSEDRNLIIDYFNLCSEEYFWYTKGRIPKKIWKSWEAGILDNLKIPQVNALLKEESQSKLALKSYYGFIEYITQKHDLYL